MCVGGGVLLSVGETLLSIALLFWSFGEHGNSLPSHQQDIWEVYFSKLAVVRKASEWPHFC